MFCEFGFEVDEHGCNICKCRPAPVAQVEESKKCPPVKCALHCRFGFAKDPVTGCPTCMFSTSLKCDLIQEINRNSYKKANAIENHLT